MTLAIANQVPADPSGIKPSQAIEFDVTGGTVFQIQATYPDGQTEIVWNGSRFAPWFAALSTQNGVTDPHHFSVRRSQGWDRPPTLQVGADVLTGPTGATGPMGPTGATGPAGPDEPILQTVVYAASVTPNWASGRHLRIGVSTGPLAIANGTSPQDGKLHIVHVQENGAGGHMPTWGSKYKFGTSGFANAEGINTADPGSNAIYEFRYKLSGDVYLCTLVSYLE